MRTASMATVFAFHTMLAAVAHAQTGTTAIASIEPSARSTQELPQPVQETSFRTLFLDLGRDVMKLPSKGTAMTLAVGGALALAAHPADRELTRHAALSPALDRAFELGDTTGSGWAQAGAAVGTFVVGRAKGNRRVQAVGADLVQAQIVTSVITQGLKVSVNRRRSDDGRFSFPSGHSSATFANATVLARHFGWRIGVPAYAIATYVGASRLQENQHYVSDVIFGAAIGIVAGRTVTVGRGTTRFVVSPVAVPGGAGVTFTHIT
jgi:membrane-associated phospholipid phosphatase